MIKLELYVAGRSRNSMLALHNLKAVLERHPEEGVDLRVIDVLEEPERALDDGVLVTPTVIRRAPSPLRILVGTMDISEDVHGLLAEGEVSA